MKIKLIFLLTLLHVTASSILNAEPNDGATIVAIAENYVNKAGYGFGQPPNIGDDTYGYIWGTIGNSFDCSGLVSWCASLRRRYTTDDLKNYYLDSVISWENIQAGDILYTNGGTSAYPEKHVMIVVNCYTINGSTKVVTIEASSSAGVVERDRDKTSIQGWNFSPYRLKTDWSWPNISVFGISDKAYYSNSRTVTFADGEYDTYRYAEQNGTKFKEGTGSSDGRTFSSEGNYSVRFFSEDWACNTNDFTYTFTIDQTAPAVFDISLPADNTWGNTDKPTFSWVSSSDSGSGLDHYELYVDGNINTDNISSLSTSVTASAPISEGEHTWYVAAVDKAGNRRQSTSSRKIKIDSIGPNVFFELPSWNTYTNTARPAISAEYSDSGIGIDTGQITLKITNPQHITSDVTLLADKTESKISYMPGSDFHEGKYSVELTIKDRLGNITTRIWSFYTDYTTPVGNITLRDNGTKYPDELSDGRCDIVGSNAQDPSLADGSPASGISKILISEDGISWVEYTYSGSKFSDYLLSDGNGRKRVYVKFKDVAGNEMQNSVSDTIYCKRETLDLAQESSAEKAPHANGSIYTTSTTVTFDWRSDYFSDTDSTNYGGIWSFWLEVEKDGSVFYTSDVGDVTSFEVPGFVNGDKCKGRVKARNNSGYWSDWGEYSRLVTISTEPPRCVGMYDNGVLTTDATKLNFGWAFEFGIAEVDKYTYAVGKSTYGKTGYDSIVSETEVGVSTHVSCRFNPKLADGQYYISVIARDKAGLIGTGASDGIIVDSDPPQVQLEVRSSKHDEYGNPILSTALKDSCTFQFFAADFTGVYDLSFKVQKSQGSNIPETVYTLFESTGGLVQSAVRTAVWDGAAVPGAAVPDGTYIYQLTCKDGAGNVALSSGTITVDSNPPEVTNGSVVVKPASHAENDIFAQSDSSIDISFDVKDTVSPFVDYKTIVEAIGADITLAIDEGRRTMDAGQTIKYSFSYNMLNSMGMSLPDGTYRVRAEVGDWVQNKSTANVIGNFTIDRTPSYAIPFYTNRMIFFTGDSVTIKYQLTEKANAELSVFNSDDKLVKSFSTQNTDPSTLNTVVWNGNDNNGIAVDDGYYTIEIKTTDRVGNINTQRVKVIKNYVPAKIRFPEADYAKVGGKLIIRGDALDPGVDNPKDFKSYKLWYSNSDAAAITDPKTPSPGTWQPLVVPAINQSSSDTQYPNSNISNRAVINEILGYLDTSSLTTGTTGTILLVTEDNSGHESYSMRKVIIESNAATASVPAISLTVPTAGQVFNLTSDSSRLDINYTLSSGSSDTQMSIEIFKMNGNAYGTLAKFEEFTIPFTLSPSPFTWQWNGRDFRNWYAESGDYTIRLTAKDKDGYGIDTKEVKISINKTAGEPIKVTSFSPSASFISSGQSITVNYQLSRLGTLNVKSKNVGTGEESVVHTQTTGVTNGSFNWASSSKGLYVFTLKTDSVDAPATTDEASFSVSVDGGSTSPTAEADIITPGNGTITQGDANFVYKASVSGERYVDESFHTTIKTTGTQYPAQGFNWKVVGSATETYYEGPEFEDIQNVGSITNFSHNSAWGGGSETRVLDVMLAENVLPFVSYTVQDTNGQNSGWATYTPYTDKLHVEAHISWGTTYGGGYNGDYTVTGKKLIKGAMNRKSISHTATGVGGDIIFGRQYEVWTDSIAVPAGAIYHSSACVIVAVKDAMIDTIYFDAATNHLMVQTRAAKSCRGLIGGFLPPGYITLEVCLYASTPATAEISKEDQGYSSVNMSSEYSTTFDAAPVPAHGGVLGPVTYSSWDDNDNVAVTIDANVLTARTNVSTPWSKTARWPVSGEFVVSKPYPFESAEITDSIFNAPADVVLSGIYTLEPVENNKVSALLDGGKLKAATTSSLSWSTSEDPGLAGGIISSVPVEFNNNINPGVFLKEGSKASLDPVVISQGYQASSYNSQNSTFWKNMTTGAVIDNPYVTIDADSANKWSLSLYYPDGTVNDSLLLGQNLSAGSGNDNDSDIDDNFNVYLATGDVAPKRFVEIKGKAYGTGFKGYSLFYKKDSEAVWKTILSKTTPVSDGVLGYMDTSNLNGDYTIKLVIQDDNGTKEDTASITIGKKVYANATTPSYVNAPYNKAYLEFAPGSVNSDTVISVSPRKLSDSNVVIEAGKPQPIGNIYDLKPKGTSFNPGVKMTARFLEGEMNDEKFGSATVYHIKDDGVLEPYDLRVTEKTTENIQIPGGGTVKVYKLTFPVSSFSSYLTIPAVPCPTLNLVEQRTNNNWLTFTGTAEPLADVEVFNDGVKSKKVTCDSAGNFTCTIELVEGKNPIMARTIRWFNNAQHRSEITDPVWVTLDLNNPAITDISVSPNPFSPDGDLVGDKTRISFGLSESANVSLNIMQNGTVVKNILNYSALNAGENKATWDGTDNSGAKLPAGRYGYTISVNDLAGNTNTVSGEIDLTFNKLPPPAPILIQPEDRLLLPQAVFKMESEGTQRQLQYKIEFSSNLFTSIYKTVDQSKNSSGWNITNAGDTQRAEYTLTQGLIGDNTYWWRGYSFDGADTSAASGIKRFTLDSTPPVTAVNSGQWAVNRNGITFLKTDSGIILTAIDNLCGVKETGYRLNGGQWQKYANPFKLPAENTAYSVEYFSKDNIDNAETLKSETFKYDTIPPQIFVLSAPQAGGKYIAKTNPINVNFKITDEISFGATAYFTLTYCVDSSKIGAKFYISSSTCIDPLDLPYYGLYNLTIEVEDCFGNRSSTTTAKFEVIWDIKSPRSQIHVGEIKYKKEGESLFVRNDTPITLSLADDLVVVGDEIGLGVLKTRYRVLGTGYSVDWKDYTEPFFIRQEGRYSIEYYSVDVLNNTEIENKYEVIADTTAPATALRVQGSEFRGNDKIFVTGQTSFTLSAQDFGIVPVGVKKIEFAIDNANYEICTGTITLANVSEGSHELHYRAWDNLDNIETEKLFEFVVDNSSPTTNISGAWTVVSENKYITSQRAVKLTATDNGVIPVGVKEINYSINEASYTVVNSSMTTLFVTTFTIVGADGVYNLSYNTIDNLNNREVVSTETFKLDNTPPLTTCRVQGARCEVNGKTYIRPDSVIEITAIDPEINGVASGVREIYYSIDSTTTYLIYNSTFTLWEGIRTVRCYAVDNLGNTELVNTKVFNVDNTKPVTELHIGKPYYTAFGRNTITQHTPLELTAIDPVTENVASAVNRIEYRVDGSNFIVYSGSFTIPLGIHMLEYRSIDNVENVEECKSMLFTVTYVDEYAAFGIEGVNVSGQGKIVGNAGSSRQVSTSGQGTVDGSSVSGVVENPFTVDIDTICSEAAGWDNLILSGKDSVILSTGTYYFDNIKITGKAKLNLEGNIRIFCRKSFEISGQGEAKYLDNIEYGLIIYSNAESELKITGQAVDMQCIFYAPKSTVTVSGQGVSFGNVFAKKVNVTGQGKITGNGRRLSNTGGALLSAPRLAKKAPAPQDFELRDSYQCPNPAKPGDKVIVRVQVGQADQVQIKIYNVAGELVHSGEIAGSSVKTMATGELCYEYEWNASNVASGVYIYVVNATRAGYSTIKDVKKGAIIK